MGTLKNLLSTSQTNKKFPQFCFEKNFRKRKYNKAGKISQENGKGDLQQERGQGIVFFSKIVTENWL